jgi:hypothetical protein
VIHFVSQKTKILKASIQDFCNKTLQEKRKRPYDLISDLIGKEYSGDGNLAFNAEEILRKRFRAHIFPLPFGSLKTFSHNP